MNIDQDIKYWEILPPILSTIFHKNKIKKKDGRPENQCYYNTLFKALYNPKNPWFILIPELEISLCDRVS